MPSRLHLASALVLAATASAACSRGEKRPGPVLFTLGLVLDRTGSIATPTWSTSIELAVRDANRGLELAGRPDLQFATVSADSANSPAIARAAAIDLVRRRGAKAILTDTSQDQLAIEALAYDPDPAQELRAPVMCIACTSPLLGDPRATDPDPVRQQAMRNLQGWGFRTSLSDEYQSRVVARLLIEPKARGADPARRFHLAIYASDDLYGHGFSDSLDKQVHALRPEARVDVVFHPVSINAARYDWARDVARVLRPRPKPDTFQRPRHRGPVPATSAPDAVVETTFPQYSAAFTRAFVASRTKTRLLHTHNFRSLRVLDPLGTLIEGQEGTSQARLGSTSSSTAFAAELEEATGSAPAFRDALAYDGAMAVMLATVLAAHGLADPAQVSGAAIRDALHRISKGERIGVGARSFQRAVQLAAAGEGFDYDGASGPCDFDEHGNVVAQVVRFRVVQQEFVDVELFDCVASSACPRAEPAAAPQAPAGDR